MKRELKYNYLRFMNVLYKTQEKDFVNSYGYWQLTRPNTIVKPTLKSNNIEDMLIVTDLVTIIRLSDEARTTSTIDNDSELEFIQEGIKCGELQLEEMYTKDLDDRGYHLVWTNRK